MPTVLGLRLCHQALVVGVDHGAGGATLSCRPVLGAVQGQMVVAESVAESICFATLACVRWESCQSVT
jgi:hypothetical protein